MRFNLSSRLALVLGAALLPGAIAPAAAQSAKDIFSYQAPGMYSEGTTKWNNYKFQFEDAERMRELREGRPASTATVTGETETAEQRLPSRINNRNKRR